MFSPEMTNSSNIFSPGRSPMYFIAISNSGSNPESLMSSNAISLTKTGFPISNTNISPPSPMEPA